MLKIKLAKPKLTDKNIHLFELEWYMLTRRLVFNELVQQVGTSISKCFDTENLHVSVTGSKLKI